MDIKVVIFMSFVVAHAGTIDESRYYKTQIGEQADSTGDNSNDHVGFVQPLDFNAFARQFLGRSEPIFGAESRKAPQKVAGTETVPTPVRDDASEFAQPVHFLSSYNSDGSKGSAYKIQHYRNPKLQGSEVHEGASENHRSYASSSRPFRQTPKGKHYGKSSYPSSKGYKRRSEPSAMEYYTDLYSKQKDVEMILPKDKAIILPMVNGKPKPYQGYRAASDVVSYESDDSDIIYGKPKKGVDSIHPFRAKRSPAEYHGGIYPHFDYSDPENAGRVAKGEDKDSHQKRRSYPKKHRSKSSEKSHDYYKYPKGNKKTNKRSSEERTDDDEEEQADEEEDQVPPYKYQYDSTFVIPELTVKYYPYERYVKNKDKRRQDDNKEEGTEDEETYESQIDEYTAGYEQYKKSLPTDLESYFGKPDFGDYSVEATENLESNKNCEKIERQQQHVENSTDEESTKSDKGTEVCYLCRDPKTGGSYEQCAYKSDPKSEKYYYGGSTSFKSDENPEPVNYRYRRSTFGENFDLDRFIFGRDSDVKRKVRQNLEQSQFGRSRPKKRYTKSWQSDSDHRDDTYPYGSYRKHDHYGSPSSRRHKKSKNKEGPPDSYDGPKYTYEGPRHTYEGPAEPYEGPINKDYYISSDDRIEDDDASQSNEESQSQPKKEYYEYNTYHPDRRHSQSSRRNKYSDEPKSEVEELEDDNYRPSHTRYSADYRFGPEHFVDDDEVKEERPRERVRSESKPKPVERRPKHSGSESGQTRATEEDNEDTGGNVKVFKNGDVCRKKKVDGMICMVCKNEKTAATYEQCQYSSKPKDKYYAFGSQKSYRTSDPNAERTERPEEVDQHPEKSDVIEKKILITKQSKVFQDNSGPLETLPSIESFHGDLLGAPSDNLETHLYDGSNNDTDNNRQVSESIMRIEPRDGIEGLEEYLYSDTEDNDKKASDEDREYKSYDEYFHDIFPEFSNRKESSPYSEESRESEEDDEAEESDESVSERRVNFDPFSNIRKFKDESPAFLEEYSVDEEDENTGSAEATNEEPLRLKDKKSRVPPDFFLEDSEEYHKKDIEKALGEFQSRDWSNCKKIVKNKLTCYQCIDKNGVNNEECMYVEASQPTKKHLTYHERKELKPETLDVGKETKAVTETAESSSQTTEASVVKKAARPKNAKEATDEVAAPVQEAPVKRRPIGDYGGVAPAPEEDVMTPVPSLTTEAIIEDTTEVSRPGSQSRRHQKRNKTSKKAVETTTERPRKRKYPLKKFNEDGSVNGTHTADVAVDSSETAVDTEALANVEISKTKLT